MSGNEPGWYPDPVRTGSFDVARYWDGRAWTEQLRAATRAERRQWSEADLADRRERAAEVRARAQAGDAEARAIVAAAVDGEVDRVARGATLARWGTRWMAAIIDGFVVQLLSILLSIRLIGRLLRVFEDYATSVQAAQDNGSPLPGSGQLLGQMVGPVLGVTLVYLGVALAYEVGFVATLQATPGKLVLHLQVEPAVGGGVVGVGQAVMRWAVKVGVNVLNVIPFAGLAVVAFYALDRLWPLWDSRRQALHDKAAGTVVVSTR